MTKEEYIERAEDYFELCNHKGWKRLMAEMEEIRTGLTATIMSSDEPCLHAKGRYQGIQQVLNTPLDAVKEHFETREQPQGQDSKEQ